MSKPQETSYKELETQLNTILRQIEDSSYDELDNLLEDYEKGMKLIEELQNRLKTAKNRITKAKK